MRYCDRCTEKPVSGTRGDGFAFCKTCLPIVDAQVALNEAAVSLAAAKAKVKVAQEMMEAKK